MTGIAMERDELGEAVARPAWLRPCKSSSSSIG